MTLLVSLITVAITTLIIYNFLGLLRYKKDLMKHEEKSIYENENK